MSSDSDSDLEFIANYQERRASSERKSQSQHLPVTRAPSLSQQQQQQQQQQQRSTVASTSQQTTERRDGSPNDVAQIRQEYWAKAGEVEILRAQLQKSRGDHQRALNEMLAVNTRHKEEHQKEIEAFQRQLEKERIQHQFLLAELRLKNAGGKNQQQQLSQLQDSAAPQRIPSSFSPSSLSAAAPPALGQRSTARPRSSHAALEDGFVLKKPKIASVCDPTAAAGIAAGSIAAGRVAAGRPQSQAQTPEAAYTGTEPDSTRLLTFLVHHRAPGFDTNSLQLLFGEQLPTESVSVGQNISTTLTLSDFASMIIGYIEAYATLENDAAELLLSVLYDAMYLGLPKPTGSTDLALRLCALLLSWVKKYEPLPKFAALKEAEPVMVLNVRLLTCILYTLDVLLASEWGFQIPFELCRRVFTFTFAPNVLTRLLDLMTAHPNARFVPLITLQLPPLPFEPSAELLFRGLMDKPGLTGALLSRRNRFPSKQCKVAHDLGELDELEAQCAQRALDSFEYMQTASVRLASALIRSSSTAASLDSHVLSLLTGSVDAHLLTPSTVVEQCVFYLWCRDDTTLRANLDASGIAELCVCLSKVVYNNNKQLKATVEQARQLLQAVTSSEEIDRLFEVFEPYVDDADYTEDFDVDENDYMTEN